jgi:hypothetical protein
MKRVCGATAHRRTLEGRLAVPRELRLPNLKIS